jgi:hypothetical protein
MEGKAGRGKAGREVDNDGAEVMQTWSAWVVGCLTMAGLARDEGERCYKNSSCR